MQLAPRRLNKEQKRKSEMSKKWEIWNQVTAIITIKDGCSSHWEFFSSGSAINHSGFRPCGTMFGATKIYLSGRGYKYNRG